MDKKKFFEPEVKVVELYAQDIMSCSTNPADCNTGGSSSDLSDDDDV